MLEQIRGLAECVFLLGGSVEGISGDDLMDLYIELQSGAEGL